jgi:large conductance mechanosensitive channel
MLPDRTAPGFRRNVAAGLSRSSARVRQALNKWLFRRHDYRVDRPDVARGILFMLKEFREFVAKGNVIDLAVAVIIGGAFSGIVKSLTDEIIMPVVGAIFGGADFSRYFILLDVPEGYEGAMDDYAALQEAGAAMIGYGAFATAIINFLILAFIIFLMVRYLKKVMAELEKQEEAAPEEPAVPSEIDLLTEIRDELKKGG